jgi:hypothetical protein
MWRAGGCVALLFSSADDLPADETPSFVNISEMTRVRMHVYTYILICIRSGIALRKFENPNYLISSISLRKFPPVLVSHILLGPPSVVLMPLAAAPAPVPHSPSSRTLTRLIFL